MSSHRSVTLPELSRLGFGCASAGGKTAKKEALIAMGVAYDAGVSLFDTARSYGFGESEAIVGEFVRDKRENVVVCTKFGILPAAQQGWKRSLRPVARAFLQAFPKARKLAQPGIAQQAVANQFSVSNLQSSLEQSLRSLGTDYVDLLLMHAAPPSVLDQDDLLRALENFVESGKIRMAGISGDAQAISEFFVRRPDALSTAQFTFNLENAGLLDRAQHNADLLLIGNQPFGGSGGALALRSKLQELRASPFLPEITREKLDDRDPQLSPELALNCALQGTGLRSTVVAMMKPAHIRSNVRALEECRFSLEELQWIRDWFSSSGISRSAT